MCPVNITQQAAKIITQLVLCPDPIFCEGKGVWRKITRSLGHDIIRWLLWHVIKSKSAGRPASYLGYGRQSTTNINCAVYRKARVSKELVLFWPITEKNRNTHKFFCKLVNSSFAFQPGKKIFSFLKRGYSFLLVSSRFVIHKRPHCFHDNIVQFADWESIILYPFHCHDQA